MAPSTAVSGNTSRVFLLAAGANAAGAFQKDLYRSEDGGRAFAPLAVNSGRAPENPIDVQPDLDLLQQQAMYNQAIAVDPEDPNTVFLGGMFAAWFVVQGGGMNPLQLVKSVCDYGMVPGELTHRAPIGLSIPIAENLACVASEPLDQFRGFATRFRRVGRSAGTDRPGIGRADEPQILRRQGPAPGFLGGVGGLYFQSEFEWRLRVWRPKTQSD